MSTTSRKGAEALSVIHHIGVSGGKDSSALLLWAVHESGLDRASIWPTFCNTHNEDELTYEHVRMLSREVCEKNGVRAIEWLEPERGFFDLAMHKKRFPSRRAQFCTDYLKLRPTQAWVKQRMAEGHTVIALSGVRADESNERSKLPEREFSDMFGCECWRPLLKWKFSDVLAIHERHNVPLNPLYGMGARRVGCFPCVNCGKREIKLVAKFRPEKIEQIREQEKRMRAAGMYWTFFQANVPTKQFRTQRHEGKDGRVFMVPTIDDVISWAHTERGGRQYEFQFDEDQHTACSARYGQCE